MRVAEMEEHYGQYSALETRIRSMVRENEFPGVFAVCEASFPHIVGAIKYRKKRGIEPETPVLPCFTTICKYAPSLFEHEAIMSMYEFVTATRALAKNDNNYLQKAEAALKHEEIARVLWNQLERAPGFLQRDIRKELAVSQEAAVDIVTVWERLRLIVRQPHSGSYTLHFVTRLDAPAEGVCPACGVRGKASKEAFLRFVTCRKCKTVGYYHLVCEA